MLQFINVATGPDSNYSGENILFHCQSELYYYPSRSLFASLVLIWSVNDFRGWSIARVIVLSMILFNFQHSTIRQVVPRKSICKINIGLAISSLVKYIYFTFLCSRLKDLYEMKSKEHFSILLPPYSPPNLIRALSRKLKHIDAITNENIQVAQKHFQKATRVSWCARQDLYDFPSVSFFFLLLFH